MVEIDGLDIEEHKRAFPERWRRTVRAWPAFWGSFIVIPFAALLNAIQSTPWSDTDSGLCAGWIVAGLLRAIDPLPVGLKVKWYLDKPTIWQRVKAIFGRA